MNSSECRYVRLHDNVNYVAAGLIIRGDTDNEEVLLIQENKKSCHGKWYMPAGRVEAGETLTVRFFYFWFYVSRNQIYT